MAQQKPSNNSVSSKLYLVGAILVSTVSLLLILDYDFDGAILPWKQHDLSRVNQSALAPETTASNPE
jgi:hypothetical protein